MSNYINREISWLEFNQRVLYEAQNEELPLLERLKFLAITGANLDEFFQVRVGGLSALYRANSTVRDIAGLTVSQQLKIIYNRAYKMNRDQYAVFNELVPKLEAEGLSLSHVDMLPEYVLSDMSRRFIEHIEPLLTPIALEDGKHPLFVMGMRIHVIAELECEGKVRHVLLNIPDVIERFVYSSDENISYYVPIEQLIVKNLDRLLPNEALLSFAFFRVTRNADIILEDEESTDYVNEMEDVLQQRNYGEVVRLELHQDVSEELKSWIMQITKATEESVFYVQHYLGLSDFMGISFASDFEHLRALGWKPQPSASIDPAESMFANISREDIMLHHPYQSFEPVVRFLEEAATDPDTLAIKQVLYRTAKNSKIVDALIKAAQHKKQVTVLVELKARFDEENNLQRADELRRAGVQIVYGVKYLKTHAKIAMVIRKEGGSLARYLHLGTGNYNESTAKIYSDISLFTKDEKYGLDASTFFNVVTGRSQITEFGKFLPAPTHMKKALLELIRSETQRAKNGQKALIMAKVNSLQDTEIIDALYEASVANVEIKLNVRGVCCLQTGDRAEAKNIEVVSIIDRYLEHTRIFYFHQGGDTQLFIASADWMTRNLDKRVELMIPIENLKHKKRLTEILYSAFKDNQNAHLISEDGTSVRKTSVSQSHSLQLSEQKLAEDSYNSLKLRRTTTFEPHFPSED